MPKRSKGVCVNGDVTSGIYFMYGCFLKTGQAQNERKNCICEKGGVNRNFYCFSFFVFFIIIKKDGEQNIYKKKTSKSLTNG